MHWFLLSLAGLFEVGWAVGLKYSEGFTRLWPSVATALLMALSVFLLAVALKHLPVGPTRYGRASGPWGPPCSASCFSGNRRLRRALRASR